MDSRSSVMTGVHVVAQALHTGADFVTAQCNPPMCTRPDVTYPEGHKTAKDCYDNSTGITISCATGFQKNGTSYSKMCHGQTGEWIPDGGCRIELFSLIGGTITLFLIVILGILLIIVFQRLRRPPDSSSVSSQVDPSSDGATNVEGRQDQPSRSGDKSETPPSRDAVGPSVSSSVGIQVNPSSDDATNVEWVRQPQLSHSVSLHSVDVSEAELSRNASVASFSMGSPPLTSTVNIHGSYNIVYMPT